MGSSSGKPVLREEDVLALAKSGGIDVGEVQEDFEAFLLENPSGKMKPKDFRKILIKAVPKLNGSKMEKHVFRMFDSDKDGLVDFTEFMTIFHIMAEGSPEEVLTRIFLLFDVNGDGFISKKEMCQLIKSMYGLLKLDNPNIAAQDVIAKTAFAEMDKNEDGKVTKEEFVMACMGQQEISEMLSLKILDIDLQMLTNYQAK